MLKYYWSQFCHFSLKGLYQYSMAAVRVHHKLDSLKTIEIYDLKVFEARSPGSMY